MNWADPAVLDKLGVVSLAVVASGSFIVALVRGWIVPGKYHREVVADRDAEITALRSALVTSTDSNNVLTRTLLEKNATDDTTNKLLVAFRQAVEVER